jgi:transcriptional regulator NrdR family protein
MSNGVCCPKCASGLVRVIDSRPSGKSARRRRCCTTCEFRWTTWEYPEDIGNVIETMELAHKEMEIAVDRWGKRIRNLRIAIGVRHD